MPESAVDRYARHTSALGLSAGHEEAFRSLKRILHAEGRFKLVLLQFNDPAYRDSVIAKLGETYPQAATLHVTAAEFPDFPTFETRLGAVAQAHPVLHVTGLESWLFPQDAPSRATGFNYHREAIAERCPAALLLWLTEPDIGQFAVEAPDMWAWRTGVLDFSVEKKGEGTSVSPREDLIEGMSLPQRVKRINEIQNYLAKEAKLSDSTRASLFNHLGRLYHAIGKEAQAIGYFESALDIHQRNGDKRKEGAELNNIGAALRFAGQLDQAYETLQRALTAHRESDDKLGESASLVNLANILVAWGKYDEALADYRQSLAIHREMGDRQREAGILNNCAEIYRMQNKFDEALDTHRQSLAISQTIGSRQGMARSLGNIANVDVELGNISQALDAYRQALAVRREIGDRVQEGLTLYNMAVAYEKLGKSGEALDAYKLSLAISREADDRNTESLVLWNLGIMLLHSEREQARAHLELSLHIKRDLRNPQYEKDLAWFNQQFPPADTSDPA